MNGYGPRRSRAFFERLETGVGALPGIAAVTAARVALLNDDASAATCPSKVSRRARHGQTFSTTRWRRLFPGTGIPLMSGREFTPADAAGAPRVVIVNESFARKFKLGRDAVGRHIGNGNQVPDILIIGLVKDAKHSNVKDTIPPLFFRPYRQNDFGVINFYVRTSLETEQLIPAVRTVMARLDANLPIENLRTMKGQVRENVAADRFVSVLAAAFASWRRSSPASGYGMLAYSDAAHGEIGCALRSAPHRARAQHDFFVRSATCCRRRIDRADPAVGLGRVAESLLPAEGLRPLCLSVQPSRCPWSCWRRFVLAQRAACDRCRPSALIDVARRSAKPRATIARHVPSDPAAASSTASCVMPCPIEPARS